MKHIVEIKFPKLFGGKKKVKEPDESMEDVEDVIIETKKQIEETSSNIKDTLKIVTPLAIALAVGYVAGYNRGLMKGLIKDANDRVIVINK